MGMGERGWRQGGLPAAGRNGSSQPAGRPAHCRADLKRQPARFGLRFQQTQTTRIKHLPERRQEEGRMVFVYLFLKGIRVC